MSRILAVDDEPDVLTILKWFLPRQAPQHEYDYAEGGVEAQKMFTENHYDLLLTDIHMPGFSGCDLARWARELRPDLVIIFLSGYTYTDEIEKCVSSVGVAARLTKPDDMEEIGACIDSALLAAQAV